MTTHGQISEFHGVPEEWTSYVERLECYFLANDVADAEKQRAILLSCCGASTYSLIRSLATPSKPTAVAYKDLVEKVTAYYAPRRSKIVSRFKFNSRSQQPGESIATYVSELRKLSEFCEYGATLDDMLCDRLVCGLAERWVQQRLLAEGDLTFDKALKIAQAMELAERDARDLQQAGAHRNVPVHRVAQPPRTARQDKDGKPCHRCGGSHDPSQCRFRDAQCHACGKKGHIKRACRSQSKVPSATGGEQPQRQAVHLAKEDTVTTPPELQEYTLYPLHDLATRPLKATVEVEDQELIMEVDTGASVTVISEATLGSIWPKQPAPPLQPTAVKLRTYTGEAIPVVGRLMVKVQYQGQEEQLPLVAVAGDGPSLLGRDWLAKLKLEWKHMFRVHAQESLQDVLERHDMVFKPELGRIKGVEAKRHINPEAQPRFYKSRSVPYALRQKVEQELDRLEEAGVIVPTQHSDWAAPIVPVVKSNGSVRICRDYKLTANTATKTESYPLPRIEDLFASLAGGKVFSKLDLSHAYLQLPLAEESQPLLTVNTHKGLYRYLRLPFGVSSAPAIFQRTMETLLQGVQHVCVYLDDILITGCSQQEHLKNLEEVLQRLEEAGMRLKQEKCTFLMPEVEYLGHKISPEGLQPTESKVRAVADAPEPKKVTELRSFLGLVNYYGKFLPNLASTAAPLYNLLKKNARWTWGKTQKAAFKGVKELLHSSDMLVHFDPEEQLILACDASPYGLGAALSHRMQDGSERPIAFASRTLAPAEKKYSQLDKEALSIIFGVKRFHQYLYGRQFIIHSDHKPLMYIFDESKAVPLMASARIQRWALTLSAYTYTIQYKAGKDHANADGLSRLPLEDAPPEVPRPAETILLMDHLAASPVSASHIRQQTDNDPTLSKVRSFVQHGWPDVLPDTSDMQPYHHRRLDLSIEDGCLLRGSRVVVPPKLHNRVVDELHEGHPGIAKMKALAHQYVWWPGLDGDLEERVKQCTPCQECRKNPPAAPLHPWEWPEQPWRRVHADYAGPYLGHMFLILIDAHSKWMEVHMTRSSTSLVTIEKMRSSFATLGLPEQLVTDNGPSFTSGEFRQFMRNNGVHHITTSPYHPSSNGLAERAVQTFKSGMKKLTEGTLETRLIRFLFHYRTTPHATTGQSPAELMLGRQLRTRLDLLKPDIGKRVRAHQEQQKRAHDAHSKPRGFQPGVQVYAKNFGQGLPWLPGVIQDLKGPVSYTIELQDGRVVRRHVDHESSHSYSPTIG